jgi:chemotaxis protein CheD
MTTHRPSIKDRRTPDHYFSGSRRYYDKTMGATLVNVHAGDCFVTDQESEIAATVLGSCISACIRDPEIGVGGMNHFLLPGSATEMDTMRFGAFAMEQLINEILKRGGVKERLEVKLFGGGNVIKSATQIGDKNILFARDYLRDEEVTIVGEDVGGTSPRKVRYQPATGRAWVMKLRRSEDYTNVAEEEARYSKQVKQDAPAADDVELF